MDLRLYRAIAGCLFLALLFLGSPADSQAQEKEAGVLASKIIDQDVYDENQKLIGEVDDIIIRRSGRAKKVTVEFGGFLDMGDKLVAVSCKNFTMKNGKVILEAALQQLKKRPEFYYFRRGLRPGYYCRTRPYSRPWPYRYRSRYSYGPHVQRRPMKPYEWAFSPSRFLASVVIDRRLINEKGKEIGRVKDLLIDRGDNKVENIIISSVDIMGEDIYIALPCEPLSFTAFGLVYDISQGQLKDFIYPYEE